MHYINKNKNIKLNPKNKKYIKPFTSSKTSKSKNTICFSLLPPFRHLYLHTVFSPKYSNDEVVWFPLVTLLAIPIADVSMPSSRWLLRDAHPI